jgi:hypothetical protein
MDWRILVFYSEPEARDKFTNIRQSMLKMFSNRKLSFFVNTVKDWNNLPPDIAAAKSLESFKSQVAKLFE